MESKDHESLPTKASSDITRMDELMEEIKGTMQSASKQLLGKMDEMERRLDALEKKLRES